VEQEISLDILFLKVENSPQSNDHQVRIIINGIDILGKDYLGIDPPRFFSQDTILKGGNTLIGRCSCGVEGCGDIYTNVLIEIDEVIWKINKWFAPHFNRETYMGLVKKQQSIILGKTSSEPRKD
jgi:hypothetical protein